MAHTDIAADGWVGRLPAPARPYALLARLDRPVGVWLLFLPGAWGILLARPPAAEAARLLLLFALGAVVMRAAGCVVNDLWDRDIDRLVARTAGRPLASGALSLREALAFLCGLLACGLAVLLQLNGTARLLGAGSLVLVALYPLAKRVTWWPQVVMGLVFGFGAPMGMAAATGRLDAATAWLYAAAILWDTGFDTIYAHQDRLDDAIAGVRSSARRLGARTAPFLAACFALTVLALAAALLTAGAPAWRLFALLPPAALLAAQVRRLDIDDPALCLRLFREHRDIGILVALAILLGRW